VPQFWLTYVELAVLMNCDVAAARAAAAVIPLDRRRSRDGLTRTKLNTALSEIFLEQLMRSVIDRQVSACADDLRRLREAMATQSGSTAIDRVRTAG
jgi:hypothetical protein